MSGSTLPSLNHITCLCYTTAGRFLTCVYDGGVQEGEAQPEQPKAPEKPAFEDDFFDSISSDATGGGSFAPVMDTNIATQHASLAASGHLTCFLRLQQACIHFVCREGGMLGVS